MHQLLIEAKHYITSIEKSEGSLEVPDASYPLLDYVGCKAFWSPKSYLSNNIFQKDGEWFDFTYLSSTLAEALDSKKKKAATSDSSCRPIWLLLSVTDERLVLSVC